MKNITKTTFEFDRMTSESIPEYKLTAEQIDALRDKKSGCYRGDTLYGETDKFDFVYDYNFLLKIFPYKIEIFQNNSCSGNTVSSKMDKNFYTHVLNNDLDLFTFEITEIYYKKRLFKKNNKYDLINVYSKELKNILYKYIDNSIWLIENKRLVVGYNYLTKLFFVIRIENMSKMKREFLYNATTLILENYKQNNKNNCKIGFYKNKNNFNTERRHYSVDIIPNCQLNNKSSHFIKNKDDYSF